MHSSGMRTTSLLTVSQHALWLRGCTCPRGMYLPGGYLPRGATCLEGVPAPGVYLPGGYLPRGLYLPGGVPAWGVYLPKGCTCLGVHLPGGCTYPGGVPAWVCTCLGVCLSGWVPAQVAPPPPREQNDRQV